MLKKKKIDVVGRKTQQSLVSLAEALKRLYPKFTADLEKVELDCYLEKFLKEGIINPTTVLISGKQFQAALGIR